MKAVFTHKAASIYDDKPEERYHFPETYLRAAESAIDDFILYYEPGRVTADDRGRYGRRAYVAVAQVTGIRPDPARRGFFYADIDPATYVTFDRPVPFRDDEHYYERQLRRADGETSKGAFGRAVRPISDQEFTEILTAGFAAELSQPSEAQPDVILPAGLMEAAADFQRSVIERILSRPVRDAAFRQAIQTAYDFDLRHDRLKLINGGGRSEAQAAHIRPVAERGPDFVSQWACVVRDGALDVRPRARLAGRPAGLSDPACAPRAAGQRAPAVQPGHAAAQPCRPTFLARTRLRRVSQKRGLQGIGA